MTNPAKVTICLWYDRDAEEAARFYANTFPDSSVANIMRAPTDYPSGKQGDVLCLLADHTDRPDPGIVRPGPCRGTTCV